MIMKNSIHKLQTNKHPMNNLTHLLIQLSEINLRYKELSRISGDNFNVFNILDIQNLEKTHSKVIAELLNPQGCHDSGDVYLKHFLSVIKVDDFQTVNVQVEKEKFVGKISSDEEAGGRIDIVITNNHESNSPIIIENKIYARDGNKQLIRYNNYNKNGKLIYLNLDSSEPSTESLGGLSKSEDITIISYSDHILRWLDLCKKDSVDKPLIRETINQYINIVKVLTGKSNSTKMENEIVGHLLKNKESVESAFLVSENINNLKKRIIKDYFIKQMKEIAKEHDYEFDYIEGDCLQKEWTFFFIKPEWKRFKIGFNFDRDNLRDLDYGITVKRDDISIPDELCQLKGYLSNKCWMYKRMPKYNIWGKLEFVEIVSGGEDLKKYILERVNELMSVAQMENIQM